MKSPKDLLVNFIINRLANSQVNMTTNHEANLMDNPLMNQRLCNFFENVAHGISLINNRLQFTPINSIYLAEGGLIDFLDKTGAEQIGLMQ